MFFLANVAENTRKDFMLQITKAQHKACFHMLKTFTIGNAAGRNRIMTGQGKGYSIDLSSVIVSKKYESTAFSQCNSIMKTVIYKCHLSSWWSKMLSVDKP